MSTATGIKAIEAGLDNIDVSISSMSMTYGHSPTESMVAILEGTTRPTNFPEANNYQFHLSEDLNFESIILDMEHPSLVYIDKENIEWN